MCEAIETPHSVMRWRLHVNITFAGTWVAQLDANRVSQANVHHGHDVEETRLDHILLAQSCP